MSSFSSHNGLIMRYRSVRLQNTNLHKANYLPISRSGPSTAIFLVLLLQVGSKSIVIYSSNPSNMKSHFLILLFFSVVTFTACEKNNDDNQPKTKTELISRANWKLASATVSGVDVTASIPGCQKDNTLAFAANGSGTSDEGATKCSSTDPQSSTFTWSFQNNETTLFISSPILSGGGNTFNIMSLTESELVLSQNVTISGIMQNAVVRFVH